MLPCAMKGYCVRRKLWRKRSTALREEDLGKPWPKPAPRPRSPGPCWARPRLSPGAARPAIGPVVVGNYALNDQLVFGGIGIRGRGMARSQAVAGRFAGAVRGHRRHPGERSRDRQEHRRQLLQEQRLRDVSRPGGNPGAQGHRRSADRHQRPLAWTHGDVGGAVRQGHVHREARRDVDHGELRHGRQRAPLWRGVPVGLPAEEPVRLRVRGGTGAERQTGAAAGGARGYRDRAGNRR